MSRPYRNDTIAASELARRRAEVDEDREVIAQRVAALATKVAAIAPLERALGKPVLEEERERTLNERDIKIVSKSPLGESGATAVVETLTDELRHLQLEERRRPQTS